MAAHQWDPTCRPARGLVRPVAVDPRGIAGPTRHEQRILEQSLRLPECGVVTGWAALRLHGARFFDGLGPDGQTELPVPLAVGRAAGSAAARVSRSAGSS